MKIFLLLAAAVALVSCNTSIGLYRDCKQGCQWTKEKIQSSNSGGGDTSGAPVY